MSHALQRFRTHIIPDVLDWVEARGGSRSAVLERSGYPPDAPLRPWVEAPIETLHRFHAEAEREIDDRQLGFHVGQRISQRTWDVIQVMCRTAPTLGAAVAQFPRLTRLFNDSVDLQVIPGDPMRIVHRVIGVPDGLSRHGNELWLTALLLHMRSATRHPITPVACWFGHAEPEDLEARLAWWGTSDVSFDAGSTGLSFSARDAERPLVTADPVLGGVLERLAQVTLTHHGGKRMGVGAKAYREIVELLPDGVPPIEKVARALAMSVRTLQRALGEEDCSYRGIIEQARRDEAHILEQSGMSEDDIAARLGYAERTSYRRARERWRERPDPT